MINDWMYTDHHLNVWKWDEILEGNLIKASKIDRAQRRLWKRHLEHIKRNDKWYRKIYLGDY